MQKIKSRRQYSKNQNQYFPRSYTLITIRRSPVRRKTTKRENLFCEIFESLDFKLGLFLPGKWFNSKPHILKVRKVIFRLKFKRYSHVNSLTARKKVILSVRHCSCCKFWDKPSKLPVKSNWNWPSFWHKVILFSIWGDQVSNTFKKLRQGWRENP